MLSEKKVVKNAVWIIIGQLYTAIFSFVMNIFTANYLGPSNYGVIGYISGFVTFFSSVGGLGFSNILIKEVIANEGEEGKVVGSALFLQMFSYALSYALTVLTIYLLNINDRVMLICAVFLGSSVLFRIFDCFTYYFQAKLKAKYISIASMIAYTIMQLYKVYLLVTSKSVEWFAAAQSIDVLVVAMLITIIYFAKKSPKLSISKKEIKVLLKQGIPFMLMGTIGVLYGTIDRLMLKEMLNTTAEVGIYNLAHNLSYCWSFVASAIIISFSTLTYEAVKKYGVDSEQYKLKMKQLYCIVFWSCVLIATCISIAIPIFIKLVYTEEYQRAILPGIVLTWAAVFAFMGSAKSVQFNCEEKQKYGVVYSALTVVVNVILNALLIPRYQSMGAAMATLLSESFICFISPLFIKKTRNVTYLMVAGVCFKGVQAREILQIIKNKLKRKKVAPVVDTKTNESTENDVEKSTNFNDIVENCNNEMDTELEKSEINLDIKPKGKGDKDGQEDN